MIIKQPATTDIPALRDLWQQAFGDTDGFLDIFFSTGFSFDRCRCLTVNGILASGLYWFDCALGNEKLAYIYAVATGEAFQRQGLCAALMEDTHQHLKDSGYDGAILVPGTEDLRRYYRRFGYANFGGISETKVSAAKPLPIRPVSAEEYAALRQKYLPSGGVELKGEMLTFFSKLARFYAGDGFVFAAEENRVIPELLGDCPDIGGIAAALGVTEMTVRTQGATPFAMYLPLEESQKAPAYFGIALD